MHPATIGIVHGGRDGRANDRAGPETGRADPPSGVTVSPLQGNTVECALARLYLLSQANRRYAFLHFFRLVLLLVALLVWQSCRPLSFVTTSPLISLLCTIIDIINLSLFSLRRHLPGRAQHGLVALVGFVRMRPQGCAGRDAQPAGSARNSHRRQGLLERMLCQPRTGRTGRRTVVLVKRGRESGRMS